MFLVPNAEGRESIILSQYMTGYILILSVELGKNKQEHKLVYSEIMSQIFYCTENLFKLKENHEGVWNTKEADDKILFGENKL